MWNISEITQEFVTARIRNILPKYIGPGANVSFLLAAETLGVERRTIESWYYGETPPSLSNFLKLAGFLGPTFTNELLHLSGQGGAHSLDPQTYEDLQLNANLASATSALADAISDGKIDHRERATINSKFAKLIPLLEGFCKRVGGE